MAAAAMGLCDRRDRQHPGSVVSVLSVNSIVASRRGLVPTPAELPIWGALMLFTTGVVVALLANVGPRKQEAA